jgi:hypothetical protein
MSIANMTPSEKARMPGTWVELDAVTDAAEVQRVWVKNLSAHQVDPGTFKLEQVEVPISTNPGAGNALINAGTWTEDGMQLRVAVQDIVAVELEA